MENQLILASGSARRKEILTEAGFHFSVEPSPADEVHDAEIPLKKLCEINAEAKAEAIATLNPDSVVIGADTLVYIDKTPLGKPRSREEAIATLKKLSGRKHKVCTGICIIQNSKKVVFNEVTKVKFKKLNDKVIDKYLSKVDVMDKAGSYAIQEHGDLIVKSFKGDYSNVVGLPQFLIARKLEEFGLFPTSVADQISEGHRYPLLYNPNARSNRGKRAMKFLMGHAKDFVLYATRDAEDATNFAAKFAAKNEPVVLAAGGDGSLNAVIQGLIGSQTALGVIPTGTMNVFARELGIPVPNMQSHNLKMALEVIKEGHITNVDLFTANGQPFVQMAGVGFDAQVIEQTSLGSKKILGPLAYMMNALKLLGDNPPRMTITLDDGTTAEGVAVLAGNGALYGGQIKLFPKADNTDGLLDILVFTESGYRFLIDSIKGIAGVLDLVNSGVEYLQAKSFTVSSDEEVPMEVDGELIGRTKKVEFKPTAHKLKVLSPKAPVGGFNKAWMSWVQNIPRKLAGDGK